jgi:hypothetical protein
MPAQVLTRLRPKTVIVAVFLVLPPILFYSILLRKSINIPFQDDYESLLDFLNQIDALRSVSAKADFFLAAQFNEYKIFFGHGLAWLQYVFLGHVDIRLLCALGNGFVLLLAILLWRMFLPTHKNLVNRMAFFIPVSWLLFQLQYAETLNWAMPGLQNLPVLVFSLGTIYLLVRTTWRAYCGAVVFFLLAVASSGNGFLLIPIGVLILTIDRRFARAMIWLVASTGCVAAYMYRYNWPPASRFHNSVIWSRPLYVIAFIGNAGAFPGRLHVLFALSLGLLLCVFFTAIASKGYFRRNRAVSYCVLFLLLTALGVAGLRSNLHIAQSLDSRYEIYSALLLIFAWFVIVEEFLQHQNVPMRHNRILLISVAGAVLFSLTMDALGLLYLTERNRILVLGMANYEHRVSSGSGLGPILAVPNQDPRLDELDQRAPAILRKSMDLGIYSPPQY